MKLKFYSLIVGTDEFGKYEMEYTVAETEEEAKLKSKNYQRAIKEGREHWVLEFTGDELLVGLYNKYNVFKIQDIEDK